MADYHSEGSRLEFICTRIGLYKTELPLRLLIHPEVILSGPENM